MNPLDWIVSCQDIGASGLQVRRTATAEECQAVERMLDLHSCQCIAVELKFTPHKQGRYRMRGRLQVKLEQLCVVSLDPVPQQLNLEPDSEFWPPDQITTGDPGSELDIGHYEDVDPEPIADGKIEFGRLVYELVASNLDPFPRKQGEELERSSTTDEQDTSTNPFAALARLKPQERGD